MTYSIEMSDSAIKQLKKLDKTLAEIIAKKLNSIRDDPFRHLKKLEGSKLWRLRIMDYRAIVDVIVTEKKIFVLRIGRRESVYD